MTRCWLHIGMPKTGSSSIQETLYYELRDPGYLYCGFGEINGSYAMSSFVGQQTHIAAIRQLKGLPLVRPYRQRMMDRLKRCLGRASSRDAALIISAEFAYGWQPEQHLWWRRFAQDHDLDLRIVIYLRPPLDWLASGLAEILKYGHKASHDELRTHVRQRMLVRPLQYTARLDMLSEVYGPENLVIRPFLPSHLLEGCVVRDFCRVVGLPQPPATIRRQNDSLSLEATQCLHLRNVDLGRPLRGPLDLLRRDALLLRLGHIFRDRPSLRLQPAVLGEQLEVVQRELATLHRRHGLELPLSTAAADAGLASLDALLALPAWASERLASAVDPGCSPEQALARLERDLAVAPVLHSISRLLRRKLRHARVGC
jgi:hypothetical protein